VLNKTQNGAITVENLTATNELNIKLLVTVFIILKSLLA
jgi:hypothetical protein